MNTKQRGDIAEAAIMLYALSRGWDVLQPVGDRLPYDLVLVIDGTFHRVQSKWAWEENGRWVINPRRCKTNRKTYRIERYDPGDFDYLVGYVNADSDFYVILIRVALEFGSNITLKGSGTLRQPRAAQYKNAWDQLTCGVEQSGSSPGP